MLPFKRFIVLAFHRYVPFGGFNDIQGSFDSLEEIEARIEQDEMWFLFNGEKFSEYQVFDCEERVMVRKLKKYPGFLRNVH